MGGCSILRCKSRSEGKCAAVTFHSFPPDKNLRNKWIEATGRKNWQPSKRSRICSLHFDKSCFIHTPQKSELEAYAFPTKYYDECFSGQASTSKRKSENVEKDKENMSPNKKICMDECFSGQASTSKIKNENEEKDKENIPPNKKIYMDPSTSHDPKYCQPEHILAERMYKKIQKKLENQKQISANRLTKLKTVQQSKRRLIKKVALLEDIVTELKCKKIINTEESEILSNIRNENKDFLKRLLQKDNCPKKYSSSLRKFALCLNFISPKAYTYVRKTFNTCLPHPKTLYNWYKCIDCEPGFTHESLEAIKTLVRKSSGKIVVALSIDEMSIRQHLQWDGNKTVGYVNVGDNLDNDSLQIAKEALVFMVTAVNGSWKLPVGYFLTSGVTGEQRSSLVKSCIQLLTECDVIVASLTFDGCPSNFAMAKLLGASFDYHTNIHPIIKIEGQEIVIFPDPCHMIKLVRNTLGDKKHITNSDGKNVSWELIQKLHELQESEGLHLANKLRKSHIEFKKQIMKVRLATQTFSKSVAEALRFCQEFEIPEFKEADATADFVNYFNDMFDILNSRKLFSYDLKKPISKENYTQVLEKIQEFMVYVHGLKIDGVSILKSGRKTGFLGLLICAESIKTLFDKLINQKDAPLKYLCTYKMSQDHLEIFFGAIRSKGGFNNNPTVIQFKAAYKRLLIHGELKNLDNCGNCIDLDDINILNVNQSDYLKKINATSNKMNDLNLEEDYEISLVDVPESHDYLGNNQLTEFSREVTIYIGGFVVKKLKKQLKCAECIFALLATADENKNNISRFIARRDVGGLNYPSKDVVDICLYSERVVRTIINCQGPHYFVDKNNMPRMILKVFEYFADRNVFASLQNHISEQNPFDNHLSLLIKSICMRYVEIRIRHVLKTISTSDTSIRNQLTKLILFKGQ